MVKVLLAGESWVSATIDHKGFDPFSHTQVEIGCARLLKALAAEGIRTFDRTTSLNSSHRQLRHSTNSMLSFCPMSAQTLCFSTLIPSLVVAQLRIGLSCLGNGSTAEAV